MKTTTQHNHETESHHQQSILRFRSAYSPRIRVSLVCPEQPYGRTKQSFKDECDINTILSKFQRTGLLEFVNERQPQYGDVSSIDFTEAMNIVVQANEMFADLPAIWRKRFNNDPVELLDFVNNPANRAEAITLGLIALPAVVPTRGTPDPVKTP